MKISRKLVIIIVSVLVLIIGGGVAYATNTPIARAERQLNLGNKYLQEGKYHEAILAFDKVLKIDPKNIPARLGLGDAYIATKDYKKAESVLKEVIDLDENNVPAREELFTVYIKEGDLVSANNILKDITTIDHEKDTTKFNADLESAKAISASKASYDQGVLYMNEKRYSPAMDSFQKVIKEDTERYADAQVKIDQCKKLFVDETIEKANKSADSKDYKKALNYLDQAIKADQNNQEVLKLKIDYANLQKEEEAKKAQENTDDYTERFKAIIGKDLKTAYSIFGNPIKEDYSDKTGRMTTQPNYENGMVSSRYPGFDTFCLISKGVQTISGVFIRRNKDIKAFGVKYGMNSDEVKNVLGPPHKSNINMEEPDRTIYYLIDRYQLVIFFENESRQKVTDIHIMINSHDELLNQLNNG
ncbi:tetratricopeptide repeat protein [Desulfosporosinus sp. HMP52]|uniref:tetratricopeptide repeat protein n=1 Tax=Desulfosporosinus sp. HMP52 TaxID=1487923 RepID=UPI00068FDB1F|nr:tetratricopeptide repeat protein [Desulfosporosinus sp. HMP52]